MLFSLYPTLTQDYFVLSFTICLGTLQWAAARNNKPVLSLLGRRGLGWPGKVVGSGLTAGGFVWFFAFTPGLLGSGLAGGELSMLFVAGGSCALAVTRLAGSVWMQVDKFSTYNLREPFLRVKRNARSVQPQLELHVADERRETGDL